MDWVVHGERTIYSSHWLSFGLIDTELPNGRRFQHEVVRAPTPAAGTVVYCPQRGVLMLWRHRFITAARGWEIPAGRVEPGESPADAAAREVYEETGWRPSTVRPLFTFNPSSGMVDQTFHVFFGESPRYESEPPDWYESERVEWVPLGELRRQLASGSIRDGLTVTALSWCFACGPLSDPNRPLAPTQSSTGPDLT